MPRTLHACCWLALAIAACDAAPDASPHTRAPEREPLVVFAASSLQAPFAQLAQALREQHPGLDVTFNFAGSQELRAQIEQGASADVFASADAQSMAALVQAGRVVESSVFARNEPVIVVGAEHATQVRGLAELPSVRRIVLGAPDVPIGRYTRALLDNASAVLGADFRARVEARVVSHELNVKQVLAKVLLGEADAGIVYRSDLARTDERVRAVAIAPELNVIAAYPVAVLRGAAHAELASAFVRLLRSERGQRVLMGSGFLAAPAPRAGLP